MEMRCCHPYATYDRAESFYVSKRVLTLKPHNSRIVRTSNWTTMVIIYEEDKTEFMCGTPLEVIKGNPRQKHTARGEDKAGIFCFVN